MSDFRKLIDEANRKRAERYERVISMKEMARALKVISDSLPDKRLKE